MKKFLLLTLITFYSCSDIFERIIDNAIPEPETLQISIKNTTQYTFENSQIVIDGYTYYFQDIPPNYFSGSHVFAYAYSDAFIRVKINGNLFIYSPLVNDESTKVTKGTYTFEVSILNYEQGKLAVHRIDD